MVKALDGTEMDRTSVTSRTLLRRKEEVSTIPLLSKCSFNMTMMRCIWLTAILTLTLIAQNFSRIYANQRVRIE